MIIAGCDQPLSGVCPQDTGDGGREGKKKIVEGRKKVERRYTPDPLQKNNVAEQWRGIKGCSIPKLY